MGDGIGRLILVIAALFLAIGITIGWIFKTTTPAPPCTDPAPKIALLKREAQIYQHAFERCEALILTGAPMDPLSDTKPLYLTRSEWAAVLELLAEIPEAIEIHRSLQGTLAAYDADPTHADPDPDTNRDTDTDPNTEDTP